MKKLGSLGIIILIGLILSFGGSTLVLKLTNQLSFSEIMAYGIFSFVIVMLLFNVLFSHIFMQGKGQEILFFLSGSLLISDLFGFVFYAMSKSGYKFAHLDWTQFLYNVVHFDISYYTTVFVVFVLFVLFYATAIDRKILNFLRNQIP